MDDDTMEVGLSKEAKRKREARENESKEATTKRLQSQRDYRKRKSAVESPEEADVRRRNDAAQKRNRRLNENPEQSKLRRSQNADRSRRWRKNVSDQTNSTLNRLNSSQLSNSPSVPESLPTETLPQNAVSAVPSSLPHSDVADYVNGPTVSPPVLASVRQIDAGPKASLPLFNLKKVGKLNRAQQAAINCLENESLISEHHCGQFDTVCEFCESLNFKGELLSRCCKNGKVDLPKLQPYPIELKSLLTGQSQYSKNFIRFIRNYNSSFAFASMGANVEPPTGNGTYCFRIHGQIYHRTSRFAQPIHGEQPKYAQLYIMESTSANAARLTEPANHGCIEPVMIELQSIFDQINPLVKSIKMLHEVEKEALAETDANGTDASKISMAIKEDRNSDPRRYNKARVNEVAIVFENVDGEPPFERDIIIHLRPENNGEYQTGTTQRISVLNPNLDAFIYPIFFPTSEQGWHPNIPHRNTYNRNKNRRVTLKQFYAYQLSYRNNFSPILNGGKLTQQYVVDAYVRAESNDLEYVRQHQGQLRAEDYCNLRDHVNSGDTVKPGKRVVLPSTFQGSPRNMQQNFLDAMAIVGKFGKPDLFVTMTCNPNWKEIKDNLSKWQKSEFRPDLVARVFNLKLRSLLSDICDKNKSIFGPIAAIMYVIEFQKRGLPHAHILIILDKENKLSDRAEIDKVVKAEIPDKNKSPRLFEIVTSHMIHGPCGKENPKAICMDNGACSKGFPKQFVESTISSEDGYPLYKRSNDTHAIIKGRIVDNRWVVPYNPFLSLKYNCHINVEVCASIQSIKYLFKYVHKGHDCANIQIKDKNNQGDETVQHVDSRYVSAPEAMWRIFCFRMHQQSHNIVRLAVHLPGKQQVYFHPGNNNDIEKRLDNSTSTLLAWFELNKNATTNAVSKNLKYAEIPTHYVFKKEPGRYYWKARQRGENKVIGRLHNVSMKDRERYFLRLLLLHVPGATGYEYLKTVERDGVLEICSSFEDAAKKRGLVLDDTTWQNTIEDAITFAMPSKLRELFGYICVFSSPPDPLALWRNNQKHFVEDYCYKMHKNVGQCVNCENFALLELEAFFNFHNTSCKNFNLPEPHQQDLLNDETRESAGNNETIVSQMCSALSEEQTLCFRKIITAFSAPQTQPKCFFLDGPGGSGKTYLYTFLSRYCKGENELVICGAFTGIAANLLLDGRTVHSIFKLPIPLTESAVSNIRLNSADAKKLHDAKLLLIDECTMLSSHAVNAIDRILKDVMGSETSFGGKTILFGGDFRQCLPVLPNASGPAIVQNSLKYCESWKCFKKLALVNNMRSVDPPFSEWLLQLGNGELTNDLGLPEDIIEIPSELICKGSIVTSIFGESLTADTCMRMRNRAILCPKNEDVDYVNDQVLSILEGDATTYLSDDSISTEFIEEAENFPVEFLNKQTPSGMPPHQLKLKVGAIIMLLRNLDSRKGLCNGTRFIVKSLLPNVILAEGLSGSAAGSIHFIPRIDLCPSDTKLPFRLQRRQFPVRLSFAMTINKSQGQTLERVGIYLPKPVFAHGQLYVAFSRVKRSTDITIKILDTATQGKLLEGSDRIFTVNVVHKSIFQTRDRF